MLHIPIDYSLLIQQEIADIACQIHAVFTPFVNRPEHESPGRYVTVLLLDPLLVVIVVNVVVFDVFQPIVRVTTIVSGYVQRPIFVRRFQGPSIGQSDDELVHIHSHATVSHGRQFRIHTEVDVERHVHG